MFSLSKMDHGRCIGRARLRGFTLFELLVTMTIIVVLAGTVLVSVDFNRSSSGLSRGTDALHSMIRVARSQALVNGVSSRVIINFDQSDSENFLRKIGVMIKDESQGGFWRAVDRGVLLPEGVFVIPRSKVTLATDWPTGAKDRKSIYRNDNNDTTNVQAVFKYEYPLLAAVSESSNSGVDWIAFQFAPNGRLEAAAYDGGGLPPISNQIVVGFGRRTPSGIDFLDFENIVGIKFKLSGASFTVEEPTQL